MKKILILIITILSSLNLRGQSLDFVMDNYFKNIGGESIVSTITASRETSFNWFRTQKNNDPEKSIPIKAITIIKTPFFRKFTSLDLWGNVSNEFFYNNKGQTDVSRYSVLKEKQKSLKVSVCSASQLLKLYRSGALKYLGEQYIGDTQYYVVSKINEENSELYFFNQQNFLFEAKKLSDRPDRIELFRDYKSTNLIQHPFLFEIHENGLLLYRQSTTDFEFNPEIDDKVFYFNQNEYEKRNEPQSKYESGRLEVSETTLNDVIQANFKGKRIFVDMWATWCAPCKKEFRSYDSAYYSLMDSNNISLVYLSIDKDADKKKWEQNIEKLGLKGYHARANKKLVEKLKVDIFDGDVITIPRYILIDETGKLLSKNFLRPSDPEFRKTIDENFDNDKN